MQVISINIYTGEEKIYISLKTAAIDLDIYAKSISQICNKRKYHKTATSKNDCQRYRFEFVN